MPDAAHRCQREQGIAQLLRNEAEQGGIDAHRHLGRVRGAGEGVEQVADTHRARVDEMEALAVLALEVGDAVDGIDDEIDRYDVDPPALDADGRHPRRQRLAQLLDQLEEIVRPVDLVHLAGARIADDEGWTVDAPGNAAFTADNALGIVLGPEVGMIEPLRFLEHVLAEQPLEQAGRRDRAEQVEVLGADRFGELHGVARAVDIDLELDLGIGLEIVDRREVEEVGRLFAQFLDVDRSNAEQRLGQVADHRDRPARVAAPELVEGGKRLALDLANQKIDDVGFVTIQQFPDQALADEARRTGDEILHFSISSSDIANHDSRGVCLVISVRPLDLYPSMPPRAEDKAVV